MALFGNFDTGKGLKKQAAAYSRMPSSQQAKRHPQLVKQLEAYANRYLYAVLTESAKINPAELRHGAEALLDSAAALESPQAAYRTFAELATRSRKVPVVPQLGQLVDRLLTQPTEQAKERAALLTWRIVTGTLSSERYLSYLRERAHLTNDSSDWRDYAVGVAKFIRDGVVQATDDQIGETLQDLVSNKASLGDQSLAIQQMLAESMMARRNYRQAEFLLTEVAISGKELSADFGPTVESLLNSRPECCWELHQYVLHLALQAYSDGEIDWASLLQKLARAKLHELDLISYLSEHPLLPHNERLSAYVLQNIASLDAEHQPRIRERWEQSYLQAGLKPPPAMVLQLDPESTAPDAPQLGNADPAELAVKNTEEIVAAVRNDLSDESEIGNLLSKYVPLDDLDINSIRAVLKQLGSGRVPDWASFEARLWFVEQMLSRGKERAALQLLDDLITQPSARDMAIMRERMDRAGLERLIQRLSAAWGDRGPDGELKLRFVQLALHRGQYELAHEQLQRIDQQARARQQGFREIEKWVVGQSSPTTQMLMTLASAQRGENDDPLAGLDTATTASLLGPDDPEVQRIYRAWTEPIPEAAVRERRIVQAMYMLTREGREDLHGIVLGEAQLLAGLPEAELGRIWAWLEELRSGSDKLPAKRQGQRRREWIAAVVDIAVSTGEWNDASDLLIEALQGLEPAEQQALLNSARNEHSVADERLAELSSRLAETEAQAQRQRVATEVQQARNNGRPLRYSAGDRRPAANGSEVEAATVTHPWRRSLGLARHKRADGDIHGAIRDLQSARELGLGNAELDIELAECFSLIGEHELARRIFGDALELIKVEHGDVELHLRALYGLATVIEHLDSPAEAAHLLEQLLTIRHDYRDTRERLDQLQIKLAAPPNGNRPSNVAANVILDEILNLLDEQNAPAADSGSTDK